MMNLSDLIFTRSIIGRSGARAAPAASSGTAHQAKSQAEQVEARLDRAMMTMEAMWTLMRDKLGITDEEFAERITEIDWSDGSLDGKVRRPAMTCGSCDRKIPRRFPRCMYCGEPIPQDPFT